MYTKFPVGTTAENDQLTLPSGVITVDTERKALRLHDGVTQGGFEVVGEQAYFEPPPGLVDTMVVSNTESIYLYGGLSGGSNAGANTAVKLFYEYNPTSQRWRHLRIPDGVLPVSGCGGVFKDGKIFISGGRLSNNNYINQHLSYDISSRTWDVLTPLPYPVAFHAAVIIDDDIYYAGGFNGGSDSIGGLIKYNLQNDTFETMAALSIPVFHPASSVIDGKLIMHGGYRHSGTSIRNQLQIYDPTINEWDVINTAVTRSQHTGFVLDNEFYIYGGWSVHGGQNSISGAIIKIDLDSGQSAPMGGLSPQRRVNSAVVDGVAYTYGNLGLLRYP